MSEKKFRREVIHANRTFIFAGEKKTEAFIILSGRVGSWITKNNKKIALDTFSNGSIIGESNLILEESSRCNYETLADTTVLRVTKDSFSILIGQEDSIVQNVIMHLAKKIRSQDDRLHEQTINSSINTTKATEIVEHLLRNIQGEKRTRYERVLLPSFNTMIKGLEKIGNEERRTKQREHLNKTISTLSGSSTIPQENKIPQKV